MKKNDLITNAIALVKKHLAISFIAMAIIFNGCSNGQTHKTESNLSATEFASKMKEDPTAVIIDVRSPEEFAEGHLAGAHNFNWNGDDFENQIATIDKLKPVFVYCLAGGRSSSAAKKMRSSGFNTVYELDGGIKKWESADLPTTVE